MHFLVSLGLQVLIGFSAAFLAQTETPGLAITSPGGGEAVQGNVDIQGVAALENMRAYEVAFMYAGSGESDLFLIAQSDQPVQAGTLATWDTSQISDGNYDLILLATLRDGSQQEVRVKGIRVRNYNLVETATPDLSVVATAIPPTPTPEPSPTVILPSPTPFGPNPAVISRSDVTYSLLRGVSFIAIGLVVLGFYVSIQRRNKRR